MLNLLVKVHISSFFGPIEVLRMARWWKFTAEFSYNRAHEKKSFEIRPESTYIGRINLGSYKDSKTGLLLKPDSGSEQYNFHSRSIQIISHHRPPDNRTPNSAEIETPWKLELKTGWALSRSLRCSNS
jgi:hypothetical protein